MFATDQKLLSPDIAWRFDQTAPESCHRTDPCAFETARRKDGMRALKAVGYLAAILRAQQTFLGIDGVTPNQLRNLHQATYSSRFRFAGSWAVDDVNGLRRAWRPIEVALLNRQSIEARRYLAKEDQVAFLVARVWSMNSLDFGTATRNARLEYHWYLTSALMISRGLAVRPARIPGTGALQQFYDGLEHARCADELGHLTDAIRSCVDKRATKTQTPAPFFVKPHFQSLRAQASFGRLVDPLGKACAESKNPAFVWRAELGQRHDFQITLPEARIERLALSLVQSRDTKRAMSSRNPDHYQQPLRI